MVEMQPFHQGTQDGEGVGIAGTGLTDIKRHTMSAKAQLLMHNRCRVWHLHVGVLVTTASS